MPYQLSHEYCDGTIKVAIRGQDDVISLETARCIASEVRAALDSHPDADSLLVDVRELRGRMRITDTFWHVREYAAKRQATRIAVIDRPENAELSRFHENAAGNLGFALRYFETTSEARVWLRVSDHAR